MRPVTGCWKNTMSLVKGDKMDYFLVLGLK